MALEFGFPIAVPGKGRLERFVQRGLSIHSARIDCEACRLCQKPIFFRGLAQLVTDQIHYIGGVFAIEDREFGIEADAGPQWVSCKGSSNGHYIGK